MEGINFLIDYNLFLKVGEPLMDKRMNVKNCEGDKHAKAALELMLLKKHMQNFDRLEITQVLFNPDYMNDKVREMVGDMMCNPEKYRKDSTGEKTEAT